MQSEQMKKDAEVICNTYARQPVLVERGLGATCYDADGKEYIDFTSGIGVNSLGFCYAPWVQAVTKQAATLQHISNLYYTSPQINLAQKLQQKTGCNKTFFCNSGAEANETAIKAARKYGMQKKGGCDIVALTSGFHGRTMGALAATQRDAYQKPFGPMLGGFSYANPDDFATVQAAITKNTCAVLLELVQGEGGVCNMSQAVVKQIATLCKEQDILLIVDEVQTGVGRTGTFLACEQYSLQPDIVTLAKGLGGGLPIGAVLFYEKVADTLQPGDHGTTFGGNPIVMAGANVVVDTLGEECLAGIRQTSEVMRKAVAGFAGVASLSGLGLMIGVELEKPECLGDIVANCRKSGLLVLTASTRLRLLPSLILTENEMQKGLEILKNSLDSVFSS